MGNGNLGDNAVGFSNLKTDGESPGVTGQIYTTDPTIYGSDRYKGDTGGAEPFVGDSFKYGGPGQCDHSAAAPPVASPPQNSDPPKIIVPPKNLGPVVIPPPVIVPQTGTGFTPPNDGSKQKRCGSGQCYDKEKDCLHGHGIHGRCNGIPEKVKKGSGSNDSCPNGMIRISPETDITSGCVLPGGKQEHPKKQEHPYNQRHDNPQKEGHGNGQRQDHPPTAGTPATGQPGRRELTDINPTRAAACGLARHERHFHSLVTGELRQTANNQQQLFFASARNGERGLQSWSGLQRKVYNRTLRGSLESICQHLARFIVTMH